MYKLNTMKNLRSLFRSSIKSTPATIAATAAKTSPVVGEILKNFVSNLDFSSAFTPKRTLVKPHKRPQPSKPPSPVHLSSLVSISVDTSSCSDSDGLSVDLLDSELEEDAFLQHVYEGHRLKVPRCSEDALEEDALEEDVYEGHGLEVPRIDAALNVLGKLGRETVMKEVIALLMKEFNALLKICIENAITTDDETVALEQVSKAFKVFISMKEQGFPIEEESYGQVLLYLIDRGMVEQFHLFTDVIRDGRASTLAILDFYDTLLNTRVNDEEKFQEFLNCIFTSDEDATIKLRVVCGFLREASLETDYYSPYLFEYQQLWYLNKNK